MMTRATCVIGMLGIGLVGAALQAGQAPDNTLTAAERSDGWRLLFDGETTNGWRGFRQDTMPDGWQAVDGALARVGQAGDIVSEEQFENFDLRVEWKIEAGGNSGIFFHVTEDAEAVWHSAPEMQVLDDDATPTAS